MTLASKSAIFGLNTTDLAKNSFDVVNSARNESACFASFFTLRIRMEANRQSNRMEQKNSACLHCQQPLAESYCAHCGQKATTHRYSLKHFFLHDFVHGVFHFDKGVLYTTKELFTRPGHSIREFVEGKRAKHFNLFTYIFLIITLSHVLGSFAKFKMEELAPTERGRSVTGRIEAFQKENPKTTSLAQIPLLAVFSLLIFRKSKQNYTENLVLNTYKSSAELLMGTLFTTATIFCKDRVIMGYLLSFLLLASLSYSVWFYKQYFSAYNYSKFGLIWRSVLASIALYVLIPLVTVVALFVEDNF
jgi:hypothetical protein